MTVVYKKKFTILLTLFLDSGDSRIPQYFANGRIFAGHLARLCVCTMYERNIVYTYKQRSTRQVDGGARTAGVYGGCSGGSLNIQRIIARARDDTPSTVTSIFVRVSGLLTRTPPAPGVLRLRAYSRRRRRRVPSFRSRRRTSVPRRRRFVTLIILARHSPARPTVTRLTTLCRARPTDRPRRRVRRRTAHVRRFFARCVATTSCVSRARRPRDRLTRRLIGDHVVGTSRRVHDTPPGPPPGRGDVRRGGFRHGPETARDNRDRSDSSFCSRPKSHDDRYAAPGVHSVPAPFSTVKTICLAFEHGS